jgi:hypothetical protein
MSVHKQCGLADIRKESLFAKYLRVFYKLDKSTDLLVNLSISIRYSLINDLFNDAGNSSAVVT